MRLGLPLLFLSLLLFFTTTITTSRAQQGPNPLYQRDKFDNRTIFRQNVCDRQAAFAAGNVTLAKALQGLELRPLIGLNSFINIRQNNEKEKQEEEEDEQGTMRIDPNYPGIVAVILDELARRGDFTWRTSYAVANESNGLPDGYTWTDMLLWSTEYYDVSVTYWIATTDRKKLGVNFPEPWMDGSLIMVALQKPVSDAWDFRAFLWLQPFSAAVWYIILATIVASGCIYWLLEVIDPKSDKSRIKHPMKGIYLTFITSTGHWDDFAPNTIPSWLFAISLSFWALLTISTYTANLASFLVIKSQPPPALESVEEAVRTKAPLCVAGTTPADTAVTSAHPNAVMVRKTDDTDAMEGVLKGDCTAAIVAKNTWDYYQGQADLNGECRLQWVGRTFRNVGAGFATKSDSGTRCTNLVRDVLNLHMDEIKMDGFLEESWQQYLAQVSTVDCSFQAAAAQGQAGEGQLRFENMAGIFVFHYALMAVAIVLAFANVRFRHWRKQTKKAIAAARNKAKEDTPNALLDSPSTDQQDNNKSHVLSDVDSVDGDIHDQVMVLHREVKRMELQHKKNVRKVTVGIQDKLTQVKVLLAKRKGLAATDKGSDVVPVNVNEGEEDASESSDSVVMNDGSESSKFSSSSTKDIIRQVPGFCEWEDCDFED